jgi:predicted  nucleic acid-binding Zn-ribbon protein
MHAQAEQNNTHTKLTENHSTMLGNLSNQTVSLKNDVQVLQERTKTIEVQLDKIAESQTIILAIFSGKPETNPVEDL